jgi:hypothetical protein
VALLVWNSITVAGGTPSSPNWGVGGRWVRDIPVLGLASTGMYIVVCSCIRYVDMSPRCAIMGTSQGTFALTNWRYTYEYNQATYKDKSI